MMARLKDVREEQFAKLLSIGVTAIDAYAQAGWRRDGSNASKRAKLPRINERVAELQAEAEAAQQPIGEATGIDHLKVVLAGAVKAGSWSAAASAAAQLARADGSAESLSSPLDISTDELVRKMAPLDLLMAYRSARRLHIDGHEPVEKVDALLVQAENLLAGWTPPAPPKTNVIGRWRSNGQG
jgi:hypothetical protein